MPQSDDSTSTGYNKPAHVISNKPNEVNAVPAGSTPVRPAERRALGLVMRQAERRGFVTPPPELLVITSTLPWSADEIDHYLDLLVTPEGRTIGGTAVLAELKGQRLDELALNELIKIADDGNWILTEKGQRISQLLTEYADSKYTWKSLIYEGSEG
jgi:hypothetical protein